MKIIVTRKGPRSFDAHLEGKPEVGGWGTCPDEAIGNMLHIYPAEFGVEIQFPVTPLPKSR